MGVLELPEVQANVFDEVHDELDQRVFNGITPRPLIVSYIRRKIFSCLRDGFVDDPEKYFKLYLTGSLTTYQYSDASDVDISLFPDYANLVKITGEDDPEQIRRMLILLVTTELDGTDLPGTPHPLQNFVQKVGASPEEMFKPGLRSAWDFQTHEWLVPPDKTRAHNPVLEFPEIFEKAKAIGEKMTILLDHHDYDAAKDLYKEVHEKRGMDPSDYSEGNIEYKWLAHKGLFERLNNEAGMHIASASKKIVEPEVISEYDEPEVDDSIPFIHYEGQLYKGEGGINHADIPGFPWDDYYANEKPEEETTLAGRYFPKTHQISFYTGPDEERANEVLDYFSKIAKGSEDTEPEGNEVGFLGEPHKTLYPPLFKGMKLRPEVAKIIKKHALDAIAEEFKNPDDFCYFTIYGSGISYNWDEKGDIDIQIWVDIDDYDGEPMTQDDLVAAVRRLIAPINFSSVKELGIDTQDEVGTTLVQYYAKPGTGSKEENLASKPYACYDLEKMKWLVRPTPIKPTFYGDAFMKMMPEANDVANEVESLCDDFERHSLEWEFWNKLNEENPNKLYATRLKQLQTKAEETQTGVIRVFKRIFKGRADAYSPTGEGINDQRDILQKYLEIWGLFQRLKRDARKELPWKTSAVHVAEAMLENPVSYHYVPLTEQELNDVGNSKDLFQSQATDFNQRALKAGDDGKVSARELAAMFNRYHGNCAYCGKPGADSFDHVVPLSRGGANDISNLLPAHIRCNQDLATWDNNLEHPYQALTPKPIPDAWKYPAVTAAKDDSEKMKVIYDFNNDSIMLGSTTAKDQPEKDGVIIGEYDGSSVKLFDVAKQWVNANYFKRLWINSFPTRPINKVFFDKHEVPTRPTNQMTYLHKLPHLTSSYQHAESDEWGYLVPNELEGDYNSRPFYYLDGQLHLSPVETEHEDFMPEEDLRRAYYGNEGVAGRVWTNHPYYFLYQGSHHPLNEAVAQELSKLEKISGDRYHDGSKWKHYLRNRDIIVDFKMGGDTVLEGKIIDWSDDTLKIKLEDGEKRTFDSDFLKQIKFKIRDDKTYLSKVFKHAVALDTSGDYFRSEGLPDSGSFGFVAGHLMLADDHHQAIMGNLIEAGWTWEQLMEADQAWGWFTVEYDYDDDDYDDEGDPKYKYYVDVSFTSDSGFQNDVDAALKAFQELYRLPAYQTGKAGVTKSEYGLGLRGRRPEEGYSTYINMGTVPPPPKAPLPPGIHENQNQLFSAWREYA